MQTITRSAGAWLRATAITFAYITAAAAFGTGLALVAEAHAAPLTLGGFA